MSIKKKHWFMVNNRRFRWDLKIFFAQRMFVVGIHSELTTFKKYLDKHIKLANLALTMGTFSGQQEHIGSKGPFLHSMMEQ